MIIDSHCHLNYDKFQSFKKETDKIYYDVCNILMRAQSAGVTKVLAVCTDLDDLEYLKQISQREDIFITVGIHPTEAKNHFLRYTQEEIFTQMLMATNLKKVVAIGEAGLDYYHEKEFMLHEQQKKIFELQIDISRRANLPLVVHCRDAFSQTFDILNNNKSFGVIHCFSGDKVFAKQILDIGYYISFSGILTFKNSQELRDVAQYVPLDRILVETDSPFLAPQVMRGKINEPANVVEVVKALSIVKSADFSEIAKITTENFYNLFSKCKK